jgi:hypothetical protein
MAWVKLDDNFTDHPKIIGLSDGAFRLYIVALCYSNRYMTDGKISTEICKKLGDSRKISELFRVHLWQDLGDFIEINSYSEYQPTKEKVEIEREKTRTRVGLLRSAKKRTGVQSPYSEESTPAPSRPVPIRKDIDISFEFFWKAYPRKTAKGAARSAYAKALVKATAEQILDGATQYAADPNRDPAFTPHGSTWLNQERWLDEALPPRKASPEDLKAQELILARQRTQREREEAQRLSLEAEERVRNAVPMPDSIKNLFNRVSTDT